MKTDCENYVIVDFHEIVMSFQASLTPATIALNMHTHLHTLVINWIIRL